jgi:hypothetical protein
MQGEQKHWDSNERSHLSYGLASQAQGQTRAVAAKDLCLEWSTDTLVSKSLMHD